MSNTIKITISDEKGNIKVVSGIGEKKAKHITDTNQWGDVMKAILDKAN